MTSIRFPEPSKAPPIEAKDFQGNKLISKKRKREEISNVEEKVKKVEQAIEEYLKDDRDVAIKLGLINRSDIKIDP